MLYLTEYFGFCIDPPIRETFEKGRLKFIFDKKRVYNFFVIFENFLLDTRTKIK